MDNGLPHLILGSRTSNLKLPQMPSFLRFCLVALMLACAGEVAGQNFYVIAARGNIKSKKTGKNLRSGDIIPADDILTFRESSDMASLFSEEGARFVVTYPGKRFKKKKNQFSVDEVRQPGGPSEFPVDPPFNTVEDAKLFFSSRPFVFLGPDTRFKVPKKLFPMSRALFFYMNYDYKEDNIDKKIEYKGDTVVMIKRNLFKIDGKEVDGKFAENFRFYYYNQPKNKHTFLGKMQPNFPVDERLKEETDVVVTRMQQKNATPEAIVKELAGFVIQHYGTAFSNDLAEWIVANYPNLSEGVKKAYAEAQVAAAAAAAAAALEQQNSKGPDTTTVKKPN